MQKYLRYAVLGLRLLFPSPRAAHQARVIAQSGLFDRAWYLETNARLPWLCRFLPIRHYLLVGEKAGLCPSPSFSPRVWRSRHPDLPAGISELFHYITSGAAAEGLEAGDHPAGARAPALPMLSAQDLPAYPAPQAVVLHLYYRDLWPEFAKRLQEQSFDFDLIVTLPEDPQSPDAAIRAAILRDFPQARIYSFPNHGRDLLPFLHLAQAGILAPYRAVCKIHTKKSPHRTDGAAWRGQLLDAVLGAPALIQARLARFLTLEPKAGIWIADGHILRGDSWWGANRARTTQLIERLDLPRTPPLGFAAGSIFWISGGLLREIAQLPLSTQDFELETGQVDGTTAHALERLLGILAQAKGYSLLEGRDLDPSSPSI